MQEIEKQPVSINVTTDASGKMKQTSEEVVSQIKAELDKIGLPYSDVVANDKGSTYFVVTKDGQQHEILKLVKTGNALVKPVLTKAKWINHLIKTQPEDLYKFVDAELAKLKGKPATTPTVPDAIAAAIAAQQAEKKAAAEKAAATETVEQEVWKRHLVKKRETLKALAGKYGTTVEAIKKANNLKSNFIREGMTLKIKMKVKKQVAKEAPATPAAVPATTPQATTEAPSSLADLEALIAATEGSDPSLLDEDIVSLQTVSVDGIEYEKSEITYSFLIELGKTSQEANEILKEIC
jgi:LysM repeat protein